VVFLRARSTDLDTLKTMIEAGKLRPHIDRTFALRDAAQAHALSETGHVRGKVVIRVVE
jgi:NADPH:quinone reductase-like Zn-dependent oxidoreductase